MMRHLKNRNPETQHLSHSPLAKTLEEEAEHWIKPNARSTPMDKPTMETEPNILFRLKTKSGTLSYSPSEDGNYTEFLRVIFDMLLAFNSGEVDPEFNLVMRKAFTAYENGESFDESDDTEESETDYVQFAIEKSKNDSIKREEIAKFVSEIPQAEKMTMRILHADEDDLNDIEKVLAKNTDLPPNELHAVLHKRNFFTLPFEKAKDVYVQLRMLDVWLTFKPEDKELQKPVKKPVKLSEITGREKLPATIEKIA